jgi:hypothetical protein
VSFARAFLLRSLFAFWFLERELRAKFKFKIFDFSF